MVILIPLYPNTPSTKGGQQAANYYLNNMRVTSTFGENRGSESHRGVDFSSLTPGKAEGMKIPALVGGKVEQVFVNNKTAGNGVIIRGTDGRQYRYIHMKNAPSLKVGQTVNAGANLGLVGNTGSSNGAHLDLKVVDTDGKTYLDPLKVIKGIAGNSSSSSNSSSSASSTTYKVGSSGDIVEQIQKKVGTYADGKYGNNTKNAVAAWQRRHGLEDDGVVGTATLKAMGIKVSATPNSNSLAVMNRENKQGGSGDGNYVSSYTNNHKTKSDALKAPGYQAYKSQLSQAVQSGAVPMSAVQALTELIGRESTWNPNANNPESTAHGYGQFINKTVANYKKKYPQYDYNNPVHQIILTFNYAVERYGSVEKALKEWDKKGWY